MSRTSSCGQPSACGSPRSIRTRRIGRRRDIPDVAEICCCTPRDTDKHVRGCLRAYRRLYQVALTPAGIRFLDADHRSDQHAAWKRVALSGRVDAAPRADVDLEG